MICNMLNRNITAFDISKYFTLKIVTFYDTIKNDIYI